MPIFKCTFVCAGVHLILVRQPCTVILKYSRPTPLPPSSASRLMVKRAFHAICCGYMHVPRSASSKKLWWFVSHADCKLKPFWLKFVGVMFTSARANEEFELKFTEPSRLLLSGENASASHVYQTMGRYWGAAQRAIAELSGEDAPQIEGETLADDVKMAVKTKVEQLWNDVQPQVTTAEGTRKLRRGITSIEKAFEQSVTNAQAQAAMAAAADRTAAVGWMGLPEVHPMTPGAPGPEENGGLVQTLMARMAATENSANLPANAEKGTQQKPQGNGTGTGVAPTPAAPVPPGLVYAAQRLLNPGPPGLRVDPLAGELAMHLLQEKWTFTHWAEAQGLSGAHRREAMTIARALELGVRDYGVGFLVSRSSEVLLRRLLSLALAAASGSHRLSSHLEELPGDGALAALPDSLMRSLSERLKMEMKLEQLSKGSK